MKGTVKWDKNLTVTFRKAIETIDAAISSQLREVMHNDRFQQLEGSWRGAHHLVMNSETSRTLKLKMFNASKKEVAKDLAKAVEFDQSQTFKKLYENEFGSPGGEPYGALYCWSSAAYLLGARLTSSFAQSGWCTAIRGAEGGGRVDDLRGIFWWSNSAKICGVRQSRCNGKC